MAQVRSLELLRRWQIMEMVRGSGIGHGSGGFPPKLDVSDPIV